MPSKKFWVLTSLFILPLIFYIILLTGTNNFAKLPVLTEEVADINSFKTADNSSLSLDKKISIICFLGDDLNKVKSNVTNLNEKIYKHFYKFLDFQFIALVPEGTEAEAESLLGKLAQVTNMQKWKFAFGTSEEIKTVFNSLETPFMLENNGYSPYAFIIDKEKKLRGRTDDEDTEGMMYGYHAERVAPIHNKMVDDVKVLVAEYRMALKKNRNEKLK